MCASSAESQRYPGLHHKNGSQQVEESDSATLLWWDPSWNIVSSSGELSKGKTWTCWSWSRGGPQKWSEMEHCSCEDRLRELAVFSLEKRRLQEDLAAAFQCLKGSYKKHVDRVFSRMCSDRTRGNGFKLKEGTLDVRKKFFYHEGTETLEQVAQRAGRYPSLETFKARLDGALSNLI